MALLRGQSLPETAGPRSLSARPPLYPNGSAAYTSHAEQPKLPIPGGLYDSMERRPSSEPKGYRIKKQRAAQLPPNSPRRRARTAHESPKPGLWREQQCSQKSPKKKAWAMEEVFNHGLSKESQLRHKSPQRSPKSPKKRARAAQELSKVSPLREQPALREMPMDGPALAPREEKGEKVPKGNGAIRATHTAATLGEQAGTSLSRTTLMKNKSLMLPSRAVVTSLADIAHSKLQRQSEAFAATTRSTLEQPADTCALTAQAVRARPQAATAVADLAQCPIDALDSRRPQPYNASSHAPARAVAKHHQRTEGAACAQALQSAQPHDCRAASCALAMMGGPSQPRKDPAVASAMQILLLPDETHLDEPRFDGGFGPSTMMYGYSDATAHCAAAAEYRQAGPIEFDRRADRQERITLAQKARLAALAGKANVTSVPSSSAVAALSVAPFIPPCSATQLPLYDLLGGSKAQGSTVRNPRVSAKGMPPHLARQVAVEQAKAADARERREQRQLQAMKERQRQAQLAARRACANL